MLINNRAVKSIKNSSVSLKTQPNNNNATSSIINSCLSLVREIDGQLLDERQENRLREGTRGLVEHLGRVHVLARVDHHRQVARGQGRLEGVVEFSRLDKVFNNLLRGDGFIIRLRSVAVVVTISHDIRQFFMNNLPHFFPCQSLLVQHLFRQMLRSSG